MKIIKILTAIAILLFAVSCSKKNDNTPPAPPPGGGGAQGGGGAPGSSQDVYVVGWQAGDGNHTIAKLWKNGVATNLDAVNGITGGGVANSVYESGNDVSVTFNEHDIPMLWKNGTTTSLSIGSTNQVVSSVTGNGSDVYVSGEQGNAYSSTYTLWKNGVASTIATGEQFSPLADKSIAFASGNDIYVLLQGQFQTLDPSIRLWKNGAISTPITPSGNFVSISIGSILVNKGDVYIGGVQHTGGTIDSPVATIWKNGVTTLLNVGTPYGYVEVNSIFVSGSDVYVAGLEKDNPDNKTIATIWKNGTPISLTNGKNNAKAYSVYVSGTGVYVAGEEDKAGYYSPVAKIWKNGVATALDNNTNTGEALAVFVK